MKDIRVFSARIYKHLESINTVFKGRISGMRNSSYQLKNNILLFTLAFLILVISQNVHADMLTGQVSILNDPPSINSVRTYHSYTDYTTNTPCTNFSAPLNRTVYVQVNVSDGNGAQEINTTGSAKVKFVLWDTIQETSFTRFGDNYVDATLELSGEIYALYTFSYEMSLIDQSRRGTESPPLYYRVKAEVIDGEYVITSDLTAGENGDYTYHGFPRIVLNEFYPNYDGGIGFIEVYNIEDYAVDVTGWLIGDENVTGSIYNLTGVIQPQQYLVYYSNVSSIFLNESGDQPRNVYPGDWWLDNYTYFEGIDVSGILYNSSLNVSFGKYPDGVGDWMLFTSPTPGAPNIIPGGGGPVRRAPMYLDIQVRCVGEPVLITLTDRFDRPVRNAVVDVYFGRDRVLSARTDGSGKVTFTPLLAGKYTVEAFGSGYITRVERVMVPYCEVTTTTTLVTVTTSTIPGVTSTQPVKATTTTIDVTTTTQPTPVTVTTTVPPTTTTTVPAAARGWGVLDMPRKILLTSFILLALLAVLYYLFKRKRGRRSKKTFIISKRKKNKKRAERREKDKS
jgi:hypothetical protein